ncbi:ATP-binding cassette domain-containing protein [Pseudanabaena sp. FACHB-1998]|uniref:phosphonate ABC transporter ATP-binding protein n=1 Tax=Pseudanabaena sp. FACHB-1998 TaxID=2692858 RepID=UPI0016819D21|nr:ATP-binding cassette domain-containing protein [Pseudanabaena sp. FACHB-1998]MBD2177449.1 ATP-binding cassette domain-containing protein [Pseudanabaena sp. FACHB-1998]
MLNSVKDHSHSSDQSPKSSAIACRNVRTGYQASLKRPILNGIDLQINQGEFVALLGLNGAGKSTLLRSLVGLVPVERGEIQVYGNPVSSANIGEVRKNVGFLFQGGGLVDQLSSLDNVLCGCLGELTTWQSLWGFPKRDRRLAMQLLQKLGLQEQIYQKAKQLSGGQRQRVAIARTLIQSPQILLADEPTTGLDVSGIEQVMESLAEMHRKGLTVVVVLHDLALAAQYAERAIVLQEGQVWYDGDCQNLEKQFARLQNLSLVQSASAA